MNTSIIRYFEKAVNRCKSKAAVKLGDNILSYEELNLKANEVAWDIINSDVSKEFETIVLLFDHGIDMIAGILGTLKAGKTYVPLDASYPEERLQYIIKDSEAQILITNNKCLELGEKLGQGALRIINIDELDKKSLVENPDIEVSLEQSAYILYTSGSTGKPKGVIQNHRNVLKHVGRFVDYMQINDNDRLALFASYSHTVAAIDIFSALLMGATLYPYNLKTQGNMMELTNWINQEEISVLHTVPSMFKAAVSTLEEGDKLSTIRLVILGGEAVTKTDFQLYKRYFDDNCYFVNLMGSTEVIVATYNILDKESEVAGETIPIGNPIEDIELLLLDEENKDTGVFQVGEIIYKSEYLSPGYWKLPEKTEEVFGIDPITGEGRIYRSGDLGRLLPDGTIEYVGRKDFQIKIRGYRVEVVEIEKLLRENEEIKEVAVVAKEDKDGNNLLCAYIVTQQEADIAKYREQLKKELPSYMVPTHIIELEDLPRTLTGKLDRRALPDTDGSAAIGVEYQAPTNEVEEKLVGLWKELLEVEEIGKSHNFFDLGGHSLKAIYLISEVRKVFNVELELTDIFQYPTIRELSGIIEEAEESIYASIQRVEEREYYELSPAQKRMYLISQMDDTGTSYNEPIIMEVTGELDKDKIHGTFKQLIQRQEILRTSFELINGEPVQRIHEKVEFEIEYMEAVDSQIDELIQGFVRKFDLTKAPLLRVGIIKLHHEKHLLMIDMDHIISDGSSLFILLKEFRELYEGKELGELAIQYKDFVVWQNQYLKSKGLKQQEAYWLETFKGEIPVLNLPTDFKRPFAMSYEGREFELELGEKITEKLETVAKSNGATMFMTILAAYNTFISRLTNQEDVIIGVPSAGRNNSVLKDIIGMFINTLAVRSYPQRDKTFSQFLQDVKSNTLKVFGNQDYQLEMLLEKVSMTRELGRNPLFDIVFNYRNVFEAENILDMKVGELTLTPHRFDKNTTTFDMTLYIYEVENKIRFVVTYRTSLFKHETIEYIMKQYIKLLEEIADDPEKRLGEYNVLSYKELQLQKKQTVEARNITLELKENGANTSIVNCFEKVAERYAKKTAAKSGTNHLTYEELNARSNQIAWAILKSQNQDTKTVTLLFEHGLDMIAAMIGAIKAGKTYVPLDTSYPEDRLQYIWKDSEAKILITNNQNLSLARKVGEEGTGVINIDTLAKGEAVDNPKVAIDIEQPAYILYTSGSTGKPKGVIQNHKNILKHVGSFVDYVQVDDNDKIALFTSYGHTVAAIDIFSMLLSGGTICLYDLKSQGNMKHLIQWINEEQISILHTIPGVFRALAGAMEKEEQLPKVRRIVLGGEAVTKKDFKLYKNYFTDECLFINFLGSTEVPAATFKILNKESEVSRENIPIGDTIEEIDVLLLDENSQPINVFQVGEIVYRSEYLSPGYWKLPEKTKEAFGIDPTTGEGRIFRSGDLGRLLPDGNIEYMGRRDFQVKIRGYRVELAEIENALNCINGISRGAVILADNEVIENSLAAFYEVAAGSTLKNDDIRQNLKTKLPSYMIPTYFVQLDTMPLTPNGKVSRTSLKLTEDNTKLINKEYVAPETNIEKVIVQLWEKVLDINSIGIYDNFFDIGGESLAALRIVSGCEKYNIKLTIADILSSPNIRELSRSIEKKQESGDIQTSKEDTFSASTIGGMDIEPVYDNSLICSEGTVASFAKWMGRDYEMMFIDSWNFDFEEDITREYHNIGERIKPRFWLDVLSNGLKKYHGIEINFWENEYPEDNLTIIEDYLNKGIPVSFCGDEFSIPWSNGYQRFNSGHWMLIVGYDKVKGNLYCTDTIYMKERAVLPLDHYIKGKFGLCAVCCADDIDAIDFNWRDILEAALKKIMGGSEESSIFEKVRKFANEVEANLDLGAEVKGFQDANFSDFFEGIKLVSLGRKKFAKMLMYLAKKYNIEAVLHIGRKMERVGSSWESIRSLLMKQYSSIDDKKIPRHEIANKIREIADRESIIAEELLTICKQEEPLEVQSPVENIMENDVVISEVMSLDLKKYFNNYGCGSLDFSTCIADLDGQKQFFSSNSMPLEGELTVGGLKFFIPKFEDGIKDNIACSGENILIPSGQYCGIAFLGCSDEGYLSEPVKIVYSDGATEEFYLELSNWMFPVQQGKTVAWEGKMASRDTNKIYELQTSVRLFTQSNSLKHKGEIKFIQLPLCSGLHVFAISLIKM